MAQVLKAHYFKHVDIVDAKLVSSPSYIWRSILWSRDLIQRGIRWKMGNGHQIRALSNRWIPHLASGKSSLCDLNMTTLVKYLISTSRAWKDDEVHELFPSFEVDYILDIPLSKQNSEDIRYWKWKINGQYSVKSGYLLEIGSYEAPTWQSAYNMETWWNLIWKLHIPQKVCIFFWRASNESIPTSTSVSYS